MKILQLLLTYCAVAGLVVCEPPVSKRPLVFRSWPPKGANAKQVAFGRNNGQQKTLVVQIRSDQPVPLVLKGNRPGQGLAHLHRGAIPHLRGPVPIKLAGPVYLKSHPILAKQSARKPLKIKLNNVKLPHSPVTSYGAPFKYEQPAVVKFAEVQKLPFETHANFHTDHFTPIHTIPAPNLALHDNHLSEDIYLPPTASQSHTQSHKNQYQVLEETNDQTVYDPLSGSQKLVAPDPDPSRPVAQIHPATEPFNQPSNGKPLPVDVQTNFLVPAQPLVQIVGAQQISQPIPEIYPVQAQLQRLVSVPSVAAGVPLYDPTYLVTQSNNLYTQHKQQLFQPTTDVIQASYVNADLTQEVASNGQILQVAKDHSLHPQFAPLIAAPALGAEQHHFGTAPFHLPNVAAAPAEGGFVVSKYYEKAAQDNSQLLEAYAEEERQRQHLEQLQQQQQQQQQQQHHQQLQQQQQQYQQLQQQQEQELLLQQQQNHLLELHQQQTQRTPQPLDPASSAFQEHQRLVQHQLGNVPLRIFVPDDEAGDGPRLQKRADNLKKVKGTVEDANPSNANDLFEVSSSVEVSSENQMNNTGDKKTNIK